MLLKWEIDGCISLPLDASKSKAIRASMLFKHIVDKFSSLCVNFVIALENRSYQLEII